MISRLNTRRPAFALAAVLALIGTGCGSSSSKDGAQTTVPPPQAAPSVTSVSIQVAKTSMAKGQQLALQATAKYSDNTAKDVTSLVGWGTSSDAVVIQVQPSAGGVAAYAIGKAKGSANVTASIGGVSATQAITVTDAVVTALTVSPVTAPLPYNLHRQLAATATYSDGTVGDATLSVSWKSSDDSIATVSPSGLLATVKPGAVKITATDGATSVAASTDVAVSTAILTSLSIKPASPAAVAKGATVQFAAEGLYSDDSKQDLTGDVKWESKNEAVATVSESGLATALLPGDAEIVASFKLNPAKTASVVLKVDGTRLASIQVEGPKDAQGAEISSVALGYTLQLKATGVLDPAITYPDVTTFVKWESSDKELAVVSASGLVTPVVAATVALPADVIIRAVDPTNTLVFGEFAVTINAAKLLKLAVAAPKVSTVPAGFDVQFKATGVFSDSDVSKPVAEVAWSLDEKAATSGIAQIDAASGVLTALKPGSVTVTATSTMDSTVKASREFTIADWTLAAITVTPAKSKLAVGYPSVKLQAAAKYVDANGAAAGEFDFTDRVAFVNDSGAAVALSGNVVTAVQAGVATVQVIYPGVSSAVASFTVTDAVLKQIDLSPGTASLHAGQSQQFKVTGTFSDGAVVDLTTSGTVQWSFDPALLAADDVGLLRGIAAGETSLYAYYYVGGLPFYDEAKVTVKPVAVLKFTEITVTPSPLKVGDVAQLKAFGELSTGEAGTAENVSANVLWASTAPAIASVNEVTGEVTALKAGAFTVIATDPVTGLWISQTFDVAAP